MSKELSSNFYESETSDTQLSHLDFSIEEDIDYTTEIKEVYDYLLGQNWDLKVDESNNMIIGNDINLINKIFELVFTKYHNRIDSVELFNIITSFYNLDGAECFKKLIAKYRKILYYDLENRMGSLKNVKKIDKNKTDLKVTLKSVFGS